MEVYRDDMLVKSVTVADHIKNLGIVFDILLKYGMRLNPDKCVFGVLGGKFLGFVVNERGIEANPEKVQAILNMAPPKTRNEVQSLIGKVVALARFISRLTDKCAPVFKLLKTHHTEKINWGPEDDKAFQVSVTAISAALVRRKNSDELPVYYIGKGFNNTESRPRTAIKGHAAANFIPREDSEPSDEMASEPHSTPKWTLNVVKSSNSKLSGVGVVIIDPEGHTYEYALQFKFKASNNAAEYEALIDGIQLAKELGVSNLAIFSDSQLVVNQVGGDFQAKEPHLSRYQSLTKTLLQRCLISHTIALIPRAQNTKADAVARLATSPPNIDIGSLKMEILEKPSIDKSFSEIFLTESKCRPSWMDPFIDYLSKGIEPTNRTIATRLRRRATLYTVQEGKLYRKGRSFSLLKCISLEVCGNHAVARNLAFKALRTGYYCPTIEQDAKRIASACLKCHQFANSPLAPSVPLSIIIAPWAYCQWGLDFIGKFSTAPGQLKFVIVAVDYNTKWAEAEALAMITVAKGLRRPIRHNDLICLTRTPIDKWPGRRVNKIIKQNLKKRLDDTKGLWAEKLPEVLWVIKMTPTEANGESPFCLSFGTEAVIPIEQEVQSNRMACFDALTNSEGLSLDSDLLEEHRERAQLRNINNKQRIARYYNAKVMPRLLSVGDWVMKEKMPTPTGLKATWEGPYEITEAVRPSTFYLRGADGITLPHPWNAQHLGYYPR
ncbi:uncharacterized protein LOC133723312 [Rosa rugosa]|uniref:uncharacterized protein LOC133723312 n=1 Tax=Rosa rugosa TaxID=74645 RepID=UPI002B40B4CD|nr:uncharacterized protein LOC133723312 [Rosa rugosa]